MNEIAWRKRKKKVWIEEKKFQIRKNFLSNSNELDVFPMVAFFYWPHVWGQRTFGTSQSYRIIDIHSIIFFFIHYLLPIQITMTFYHLIECVYRFRFTFFLISFFFIFFSSVFYFASITDTGFIIIHSNLNISPKSTRIGMKKRKNNTKTFFFQSHVVSLFTIEEKKIHLNATTHSSSFKV